MSSVADLPDDGTADQFANQPYRLEPVDQDKSWWHASFTCTGDDEERDATDEEVAEEFGAILRATRELEQLWQVQADWLDAALAGSGHSIRLEFQKNYIVLVVEWDH